MHAHRVSPAIRSMLSFGVGTTDGFEQILNGNSIWDFFIAITTRSRCAALTILTSTSKMMLIVSCKVYTFEFFINFFSGCPVKIVRIDPKCIFVNNSLNHFIVTKTLFIFFCCRLCQDPVVMAQVWHQAVDTIARNNRPLIVL